MSKPLTAFAFCACLAIFAVRGYFAVVATSPTFDEAVHLTAGYSYWRTGDFRMNRETPPLMKLLWALPLVLVERPPFQPDPDQWERNDIWRMGDALLYESPVHFEDMLNPARGVNVAVGAMLVALVGWWTLRLWGQAAAVAAWAFAAIDPNLMGQAAVLSTDVGLALFCTAAAYCLWEYAGNPKLIWFLLAGVSLGLALATKYSAGVAVVGIGVGAIVYVWRGGPLALPGKAASGRWSSLVSAFVRLGLIAAIAILPSYFLVNALDWPRGLRLQLGRNEFEPPRYYLNGEVSTHGWYWYFVEVLALKTPVGALVLALMSLACLRFTRRDVAFLIAPPLAFFVIMSAARLDIGIRVILPAYVILWLLAARIASLGKQWWLTGIVVAVGAFAPWIADGDLFGQRSLSYFNGVPVARQDGHRYLSDSNIDWGQGLGNLSAELGARGNPVIFLSYAGTARPEAEGIRFERLPGWGEFRDAPPDRVDPAGPILVAISVSNLQGTYLRDPNLYRWLLDREAISRLDGSIWLFDVTGDEEAIAHLRRTIARSP